MLIDTYIDTNNPKLYAHITPAYPHFDVWSFRLFKISSASVTFMSFSSAFFAGVPWTSGAGAKETFLLTLLEDETEETPGLPVLLGGGVVNLSLFASSFFAAFFKLLALGLRPRAGAGMDLDRTRWVGATGATGAAGAFVLAMVP